MSEWNKHINQVDQDLKEIVTRSLEFSIFELFLWWVVEGKEKRAIEEEGGKYERKHKDTCWLKDVNKKKTQAFSWYYKLCS